MLVSIRETIRRHVRYRDAPSQSSTARHRSTAIRNPRKPKRREPFRNESEWSSSLDNMRLGGTELNAVRTAERLDRERFDLSVVCLGETARLRSDTGRWACQSRTCRSAASTGRACCAAAMRFVRMLRRERVDIVHAHDVYSNIFSAVWARAAGVPVLITSRRWWNSLPNWKLKLGNRLPCRGRLQYSRTAARSRNW